MKEHNIQTSLALGAKHQNQVSESINDKIKYETILHLLNQDNRPLRNLIKIQPSTFKYKSNEQLSTQLTDLQDQFNSVVEELDFLKKERQQKLDRKEARLRRNKLRLKSMNCLFKQLLVKITKQLA